MWVFFPSCFWTIFTLEFFKIWDTFLGRRSVVAYSPWGRKESDMTEQLHFLFFFQHKAVSFYYFFDYFLPSISSALSRTPSNQMLELSSWATLFLNFSESYTFYFFVFFFPALWVSMFSPCGSVVLVDILVLLF